MDDGATLPLMVLVCERVRRERVGRSSVQMPPTTAIQKLWWYAPPDVFLMRLFSTVDVLLLLIFPPSLDSLWESSQGDRVCHFCQATAVLRLGQPICCPRCRSLLIRRIGAV